MVFIDFRSGFSTITSQQLTHKPDQMVVGTSFCNWLLDFLTQFRLAMSHKARVRLRIGAPQGQVLSHFLLTHNCTPNYKTSHHWKEKHSNNAIPTPIISCFYKAPLRASWPLASLCGLAILPPQLVNSWSERSREDNCCSPRTFKTLAGSTKLSASWLTPLSPQIMSSVSYPQEEVSEPLCLHHHAEKPLYPLWGYWWINKQSNIQKHWSLTQQKHKHAKQLCFLHEVLHITTAAYEDKAAAFLSYNICCCFTTHIYIFCTFTMYRNLSTHNASAYITVFTITLPLTVPLFTCTFTDVSQSYLFLSEREITFLSWVPSTCGRINNTADFLLKYDKQQT